MFASQIYEPKMYFYLVTKLLLREIVVATMRNTLSYF